MTKNSQGSLLELMKELYQEVVNRYLKWRMNSYRVGGASESRAIGHGLEERINKLAGASKSGASLSAVASAAPKGESPARDHNLSTVESSKATERYCELSQHFKTAHPSSSFQSSVGSKLQQSTWEHVHAAILHARQGDKRTAQLHVGIANNALQELAHYLPEQLYNSFVNEVVKVLDESIP